MDITKLPLFETMRERMAFLSARQTVLAENVANANTPGYRARDVEAPDFAAIAAGENEGNLTVTNPMHISSAGTPAGNFRIKDMPDADFSQWVQPEAIADVIVFLASPAARAITGALIPVTRGG